MLAALVCCDNQNGVKMFGIFWNMVASFDSLWFWKLRAIHSFAFLIQTRPPLCSPNEAQSDGLPRRDACRDVFPTRVVDFPNCWGKQATTHNNNLKDFLCSPLPEEMIHLWLILYFSDVLNSFYKARKKKKAVAKQKSPSPDIFFVDSPSIFSTQDLGPNTKTVDQRCGWKAWMCHSK